MGAKFVPVRAIPVQGERATYKASRLALFVAFAHLTGCGTKPVAPVTQGYVRLAYLLPLHPDWRQLASLDSASRMLSAPVHGVRVEAPPVLVQPMLPPQGAAIPYAVGISSPLERTLQTYLAHQTGESAMRNGKRLARFQKVAERAMTQRLNELRRQIEAVVADENQKSASEIEGKILALGYRQVALTSQIRAYAGQSRTDAVLQTETLGREIAALTSRQSSLTGDLRPEVDRRLEAQRKKMQQDLDVRIAARSAELDANAANIERQLKVRIERLSAASAARLVPSTPPGRRLREGITIGPEALSPAIATTTAAASDRSRLGAAAMQREAERVWVKQRALESRIITEDVREQARSVALALGVTLVDEPTRGAKDVTELVAAALRRRWQE